MSGYAETVEMRGGGSFRSLIDRLNGPWHERALWIYMGIVVLHWIEHLLQAYQIWVLEMARPESLGALGMLAPWLVQTEVLHFGYAVVMLLGLIALRPGFAGASRVWWNISLAIQSWHFVEHFVLQAQALAGQNMFGSPVPTSFVQLWVPRPELHLIYNAVVFIPMIIAAVLHNRRPQGATCSCAL